MASTTNSVSTGFSTGVQVLDLAHQRLVDRQPASGVDQQHVEIVLAGIVERGRRDVQRLLV
jgi:hypothetical protein